MTITAVGYVHESGDSYVDTFTLQRLAQENNWTRKWSFRNRTASIELPGRRYVKDWHRFSGHADDANHFVDFLAECYERGIERPSSYADCFHSIFYSPRVPSSVNALFRSVFKAGWQEARMYGTQAGLWRSYDLNRAYYAASQCGLPDMATIRRSARIHMCFPGLYRVRLSAVSENAPYPFSQYTEVVCTDMEVEMYGLRIDHIYGGVIWEATLPRDVCTRVIDSFSFGKLVGRSYWGRWASTSPVTCSAMKSGKEWDLRNPVENFVWAAVIVAEVKRRIWDVIAAGHKVAHIFVDSVLIDGELETGQKAGEWKLVHEFPRGIHVRGPGYYGEPGKKPYKHSGVPAFKTGELT